MTSVSDLLRGTPTLWNEWRSQLDNPLVDLKGTDLRRLVLQDFDLHDVDLSGAKLNGCNFSRVDLTGASLRGADLCEAKISAAILTGAEFCDANLQGSHLELCLFGASELSQCSFVKSDFNFVQFHDCEMIGTNFRGAYMDNVEFNTPYSTREMDFTKAQIANCRFANVDLRELKGLSTVKHLGHSSVDIDTLYRSRGTVAQAFLRGCGLPDGLLLEIPRLFGSGEFYSCFISHSSGDKTFCDRLEESLRDLGVRVWYFETDAKWGRKVWSEIDDNVPEYEKMILVCSSSSLVSGPVLREIERALDREDREGKEVLFPIRIDDYVLNEWNHPRASDVRAKVIGDFRAWRSAQTYDKAVQKLLKNLST